MTSSLNLVPFIVIEGPDGVGKSETVKHLQKLMDQERPPGSFSMVYNRVLYTREPDYGLAGGAFIASYLQGLPKPEMMPSFHTMALAFAMNRKHHCETVIEPWIQEQRSAENMQAQEIHNGHVNSMVICDRYTLSNMVYQGFQEHNPEGVPLSFIRDINMASLKPNLHITLLANPQALVRRRAQRASQGGEVSIFDEASLGKAKETLDAYVNTLHKVALMPNFLAPGGKFIVIRTDNLTPDKVASVVYEKIFQSSEGVLF